MSPRISVNPNYRNWIRDIVNASVNKVYPGNQRNTTSRDFRGFNDNSDFGQNFSMEGIRESITVGFAITGI